MNSTTSVFPPEIAFYRQQIDEALQSYTEFDGDCPQHLGDAIRYALLAPGKRIRPLLVINSALLCGGELDNALPAACAVEMIHAYSLIHDDLPAMDDDELRRGRPTCHIQFDEATAILAGDALIPRAFEIISRDVAPPSVALRCVTALAQAAGASRLVGGQADDLNQQFTDPDVETLEKIHRRKTGALLAVSLELGALTAGATDEKRKSLKKYGNHLGLAFQIADDLLDLHGSQAKMGKKTGKDSERGKLTYPAVLGLQESERRAHQMAESAIEALREFGSGADPLRSLARFVVNRTH